MAGLAEVASRRPGLRTLAHIVGLSPAAQDFDAIMAVNLVGASRIADAFVDILEPGGAGIFISSSAHMRPVPEVLGPVLDDALADDFLAHAAAVLGHRADAAHAYMFSKAGLMRMCVRLAPRWGKRGLRIVSLSPGLIATIRPS